MSNRIRFLLVGAGMRSDSLYGRLLASLSDEVELVGIWGRSPEKARLLGEKYRLPWSIDLEHLVHETSPQAAIVSVAYEANGEIGRRVIKLGLHALLETPIAHDLADADAIIREAAAQQLKVEVAEQYYRRPMERVKRALIQAGKFGHVFTAYNDFMGHGYHGMSLIRSYIGFDIPVISVSGVAADFSATPTYAWISKAVEARQEHWEHATLRFRDGQVGIFNWSNLAYDSPLRWLRSTKFFAERGMAVGDTLTLLTADGRDPLPVPVERRFHNVGGMEVLSELVAHSTPELIWTNPFRGYALDDEMIAVADCLMSLVRAIREDRPPEYGLEQARLDQELTLAMHASARHLGEPVSLPLRKDLQI